MYADSITADGYFEFVEYVIKEYISLTSSYPEGKTIEHEQLRDIVNMSKFINGSLHLLFCCPLPALLMKRTQELRDRYKANQYFIGLGGTIDSFLTGNDPGD